MTAAKAAPSCTSWSTARAYRSPSPSRPPTSTTAKHSPHWSKQSGPSGPAAAHAAAARPSCMPTRPTTPPTCAHSCAHGASPRGSPRRPVQPAPPPAPLDRRIRPVLAARPPPTHPPLRTQATNFLPRTRRSPHLLQPPHQDETRPKLIPSAQLARLYIKPQKRKELARCCLLELCGDIQLRDGHARHRCRLICSLLSRCQDSSSLIMGYMQLHLETTP